MYFVKNQVFKIFKQTVTRYIDTPRHSIFDIDIITTALSHYNVDKISKYITL